jgi:nitrate reductase gamma subunit
MSIFLVFPFTRLVHVWSGFGTIAYALRPYQLVRSRRLNLPANHLASRRTLAHAPAAAASSPRTPPAAPPQGAAHPERANA